MERIDNNELISNLYEKYDIASFFETDFKKDLFLVKFKKGEVIQRDGYAMENLYFMVGGSVKVSTNAENGKSRLICLLDGFEILGDIELFAGMNYVNNVIAIKDTLCLGLSMNKYREVLRDDTVFAKYMSKVLAKIVLSNNESTSFNLLYPLETRVATYILYSAKDNCFKEKLTDVSEVLATSYRHLQRVLAKFCDSGVLQKEGRCYIIVDMQRLKSMSNETVTQFGI